LVRRRFKTLSKKHLVLRSELYSKVLEVLQRMGGKALEENLLEELKKRGIEVTQSDLRSVLMKLEIHDKVRVLSLDEEKKLIELITKT
jgi:Fe2+ or Zn2+ uptake regulation protein